jgi:hypothetical protein
LSDSRFSSVALLLLVKALRRLGRAMVLVEGGGGEERERRLLFRDDTRALASELNLVALGAVRRVPEVRIGGLARRVLLVSIPRSRYLFEEREREDADDEEEESRWRIEDLWHERNETRKKNSTFDHDLF